MALYVSSLNSGSNGNCYFVSNGEDSILVDAGLSRGETEKRLQRIGSTLAKINAIFITHEHGDHVHGLYGICKKFSIPVFISERTYRNCGIEVSPEMLRYLESDESVTVGDLTIKSFSKLHDASDPQAYTVTCNGVTIGVFTDIGSPCSNVRMHFQQCHAAFLEANYDEDLLEKGGYPWPLKNRIRGGYGHLSNSQAVNFFLENRPHFMSHLFLSHLSRDNNSPELALNLFQKVAGKTKVLVAGRYEPTDLIAIRDLGRNYTLKPLVPKTELKKAQLSLF